MINNKNFQKAVHTFLAKVNKTNPHFDKTPSETNSSERMGGWLIRDTYNMISGFVGNRGDVQVYNYIDASQAS